jgi:hypothetical protein
MNRTNPCGKCGSPDLFIIPATPAEQSHIVVGDRVMRNIAIYRCVCTNCGCVEEWVRDAVDLQTLKAECARERAEMVS